MLRDLSRTRQREESEILLPLLPFNKEQMIEGKLVCLSTLGQYIDNP